MSRLLANNELSMPQHRLSRPDTTISTHLLRTHANSYAIRDICRGEKHDPISFNYPFSHNSVRRILHTQLHPYKFSAATLDSIHRPSFRIPNERAERNSYRVFGFSDNDARVNTVVVRFQGVGRWVNKIEDHSRALFLDTKRGHLGPRHGLDTLDHCCDGA